MKTTNPRMLRVMNWLMEKAPGERILIDGRMSAVWLYDTVGHVGGKPVLERIYPSSHDVDIETLRAFGGNLNVGLTETMRAGLLTSNSKNYVFGDKEAMARRQEFLSGYAGDKLPDDATICFANEATVAWWKKEGKALHEAAVEKGKETSSRVERTVVLAAMAYVNYPVPSDLANLLPEKMTLPALPVRRRIPYATARVTRETGKRLYVTDVKYMGYETGLMDIRNSGVVMGLRPNEYVELESVYMDRVDAQTVAKLKAAETEFVQDLQSIHAQMLRDVASTLSTFANRMKQKMAERDDALREIVTGRPDV